MSEVSELADLTGVVLDGSAPSGPDAVWAGLASAGVLAAALPEDAGGSGLGVAGHAAVLRVLGAHVVATPYRDAVAVAAETLARHGTAQQRRTWLEPALRGALRLATAWREPDGAVPATPVTRAVPAGTGWELTGSKTMVCAGPSADVLFVPATGPAGPLVLAVPTDLPGVRVEPQDLVDGVLPAAWVELAGAHVDADHVVGDEADGATVLAEVLVRQALAACAEQVGVLAAAVRSTAGYARERQQFGRPIGAFQAVSQRLADALIDARAAELTTAEALRVFTAAGETVTPEVLTAVDTAAYWATEAGHRVAHTCVHVHGGTGLDLDHPAHRYFATAKRLEFELGGATQRLRALGAALTRS
ncbi:acyl-CoA dehydrogenase family protein [Spongisporangium articulatum]|uniref:Acyl-CoA dehydrogenase family protein n=1 Tax=Spongisporangium articulatum TaxID=3362603 RepID=A0ABW8AW03_9ACTN